MKPFESVLGAAIVVVGGALLPSGARAQEQLLVGYNDPAGGAFTIAPFGTTTPRRFQQVYESSIFLPQIAAGGWITDIVLNTINFLPQDLNLQIDFSTTPRGADNLSVEFASNVGHDNTVVLPRMNMAVGAMRDIGTANIKIPLSTAFFYDPTKGNLLMDMRVFEFRMGGTRLAPATDILGDPVSVVVGGIDSVTGTVGTLGLDTFFRITPVPEPRGVAIVLAGVLSLSLFRIRIRHSHTSTKET